MTFLDKLFTTKNKFFKCDLNTSLSCSKQRDVCNRGQLGREQVRVVLFRECERRGRKLLFDSDAVEKIRNDCSGWSANHPDIVEVNVSHAYKYKKPSKDVSCLGDMIFGSVAIASKGGTTYKIHNIPAPHRLLFTTVLPTSSRCHNKSKDRRSSGHLPEHSSHIQNTGTCSSDSSICGLAPRNPPRSFLSPEEGCRRTFHHGLYSSETSIFRTERCSLQKSEEPRSAGLHRSSGSASLRTMGSNCFESRLSPLPACCEDGYVPPYPSSRRTSDSPSCSFGSARSFHSSFGSQSDIRSSNLSLNCSGGSLNSLRRRWNQSLAVSLDLSSCDDSEDVPNRVRTKLGLALLVNISGPSEIELEKFLLNNSLPMESILETLRQRMTEAYSRFESFVQLSLAATESAAAAVAELASRRQYLRPRWLRPYMGPCSRNAVGIGTPQDRFVAAFTSVLMAFESKATNFMVSTLLTTMLTHNLSWVPSIAAKLSTDSYDQTDLKGGYNPIWAQNRDLFGAIGTPARTAKVVVADSSNHPSLHNLIDVLTYFLRCSTVLEHRFEGDFDTITCLQQNNSAKEELIPKVEKECENEVILLSEQAGCDGFDIIDDNFDSGVDCELRETVLRACSPPESLPQRCFEVLVNSSAPSVCPSRSLYPDLKQITDETELKTGISEKKCWSKDFFSHLFREDCKNTTLNDLVNPEKMKFVDSFTVSEQSKSCCNSLIGSCSHFDGSKEKKKTVSLQWNQKVTSKKPQEIKIKQGIEEQFNLVSEETHSGRLYPSIDALALLENVRLEDLTSERDKTLFVQDVLLMTDNLNKTYINEDVSRGSATKSPTPDEGYDTLDGDSVLARERNVLFLVGDSETVANRTVVTKSSPIEPELERPRRRRKCPTRSRTVNIPVCVGLKLLQQRSRTMDDVAKECSKGDDHTFDFTHPVMTVAEQRFSCIFQELPFPRCVGPTRSDVLPVSPVIGGVSPMLHPHQVLQAITTPAQQLEDEIHRDLKSISETKRHILLQSEVAYILADLQKWDVSVYTSHHTALGSPKAIRATTSQLIADMLESFGHLHRLGLSASCCLEHLETKLGEIYRKSEAVAQLLMATEFCTVDLLTSQLHLTVNDVPLLLSVASMHTPEIAEKYGISFS